MRSSIACSTSSSKQLSRCTQTDDGAIISASSQAPAPHRFDFVHNLELRPVLEQAYSDGRDAQDHGDFDLALLTFCGILESIMTDALEHKRADALADSGMPAGKIADWSFETRIAVAEKMGLIRGGCARLPAVARTYRDPSSENDSGTTVSERDARIAGQVLNVVMRSTLSRAVEKNPPGNTRFFVGHFSRDVQPASSIVFTDCAKPKMPPSLKALVSF